MNSIGTRQKIWRKKSLSNFSQFLESRVLTLWFVQTAAQGTLLEMHILGLYYRLTDSGTLRVGPSYLCFNEVISTAR